MRLSLRYAFYKIVLTKLVFTLAFQSYIIIINKQIEIINIYLTFIF